MFPCNAVANCQKKSKKSKKSKSSAATIQWGQYGIIHDADIFTKEAVSKNPQNTANETFLLIWLWYRNFKLG